MTTRTVNLHVDSVDAMGAHFVDAWKRAERGERFEERHVTVLDLQTLVALLAPKRLELLRHVHRAGGAASIRALSQALGREYKRVRTDVKELEAAGLLVQDDGHLAAPFDAVRAEVTLAP